MKKKPVLWNAFSKSNHSENLFYTKLVFTTFDNLGPVHTNPFSNENGTVLLRMRLSSTLQRRKRSQKTEPFENALQSGGIWNDASWKCCVLMEKTMPSENGDVIKIDTKPGARPTRPWVSKMADRRYHVASLLISVVVWTGENDTKTISVYANLFENGTKQLRFRLKTD